MTEAAQTTDHAKLLDDIKSTVSSVITSELSKRDEKLDELGRRADEQAEHIRSAQELVKATKDEILADVEEKTRAAQARQKRASVLGWGGDPEQVAGEDGDEDDARLSLGEAFTRSEAFKNFAKSVQATRKGTTVKAQSAKFIRATPMLRAGMRSKLMTMVAAAQYGRATSHDATQLGALGDRTFLETVLDPQRRTFIRDVIPSRQVPNDTNTYPRETFWHAITATAESGPHGTGQADLVVDNTYGFRVGSSIYKGATASGTLIGVIDSIDHDTSTITCAANLAVAVSDGDEVWSNEFTYVPEGKLKPNVEAKFADVTIETETIPSTARLTKKQLRDARQVERIINTKMANSLDISEEKVFLYGDSGNSIDGLLSVSGTQDVTWSNLPSGHTRVDALRNAITLVELAEHMAGLLIINPQDAEYLDVEKSATDGHYYLQNAPLSTTMSSGPWGLRVVKSTAIAAGTALVMDPTAAEIYDREQTTLAMSEDDRDNFVTNRVTIRMERTSMIAIYYPAAIAVVTWDSAP